MTQGSSQNRTLAIAVVCLLAFFAVGSANLKVYPIGNDEYNSLSHIQDPAKGIVYNLAETVESVAQRSKQHGPLYFLLLNAWRTLAGADVFVLRLSSLFLGMLTVACACHIASACRDRQMGISALFIATFLAYHLFYSHTARMYTLLPLAAAWLLWSYWRVVSATARLPFWRWLSLFLSAALILYLHYFGVMMLGAIGLYHLLFAAKGRRWPLVVMTLLLAGLCFLPWLPVAIAGFTSRLSLASSRLPLHESLYTTMLVFSNTLVFLPLAAAALALRYRGRLNRAERFILLITGFTLLLAVAVNEFTPILVARRMRYMTLLMLPFCCSLAIGLRLLPGWHFWRLPLLALWLAAFIIFYRSEDLLNYANRLIQRLHQIPRYQEFIYEAERLPGYNELILSFHPDVPIPVIKTLTYYRAALSQYAQVAHVAYNQAGELEIQSNLSTYFTPQAIAENASGIWVLYDPTETDLMAMDIYRDWFSQRYQPCQRYLEKPKSVIDYYLRADVPCELVTAAEKLNIHYDNGTQLDHLLYQQSAGSLDFKLRWLREGDAVYSFSLQIVDPQGEQGGAARSRDWRRTHRYRQPGYLAFVGRRIPRHADCLRIRKPGRAARRSTGYRPAIRARDRSRPLHNRAMRRSRRPRSRRLPLHC